MDLLAAESAVALNKPRFGKEHGMRIVTSMLKTFCVAILVIFVLPAWAQDRPTCTMLHNDQDPPTNHINRGLCEMAGKIFSMPRKNLSSCLA